MDLTRTLNVTIDPRGAQTGGAQATAAFRQVGGAAKDMEAQNKRTQSSISGVSTALSFLKTALAGIGLGMLVRELYETSNSMARLQNQLKASSGGVDEFKKNFEFLRGTSARLGLDLRATGDAFGQFVASAKGKLTGAQIRESFQGITEASTTLSLSAEQTSGTIVALSQMLSKGTVASQELKMQLGNALPGAFQMAAQAMGVTEKEMNKMLDSGSIMADDLVPKLTKKLHEAFGPGSVEGAKTLQAEMNRLKTAWLEVQMVFMGEGGNNLFSNVLKGAKSALDDFKGWMAAMFQANKEGQLSEAVAASLRIGFGKAANYFAGFVKTAAEMLAAAGKVMFTAEYFTALLGSFQAVAAGFGIAFLEALSKPLAYVQAFFENIFDKVINSSKYTKAADQAKSDVLTKDSRFAGKTENGMIGLFGAMTRSPAEDDLLAQFRTAVAARTAQLQREVGDQTISERANAIMASGGVRLGFSGEGNTLAQLKAMNDQNMAASLSGLAGQSATGINAALGAMKGFAPIDAVNTSADEAYLSGFGKRSKNPFAQDASGFAGAAASPETQKTFWDDIKKGIDDAADSLKNMQSQMVTIGKDSTQAMANGFTDFFTNIADGTESIARKFTKMTQSILADIAKIIMQRAVAEPLAGGLMSGSIFSGMFGGGASSITPGDATASMTLVNHAGGIVGATTAHRLADPSLFSNAPRFHNGLQPDEFPAILQRGEAVIPANQVGKQGVAMSMPITVHVDGGKGGTPEQNQKFGAEIARQIQDMIDQRIARAVMPRGVLSSARA